MTSDQRPVTSDQYPVPVQQLATDCGVGVYCLLVTEYWLLLFRSCCRAIVLPINRPHDNHVATRLSRELEGLLTAVEQPVRRREGSPLVTVARPLGACDRTQIVFHRHDPMITGPIEACHRRGVIDREPTADPADFDGSVRVAGVNQ